LPDSPPCASHRNTPAILPASFKESPVTARTTETAPFRLLTPAAARAANRSCAGADLEGLREFSAVICDQAASLAFATSARAKSDTMADTAEGAMALRDAALSLAEHHADAIHLGLADPSGAAAPATIGGQRARLDMACAALPGLLASLGAETDPARRAARCVTLARAGWAIYEAAEVLSQLYWDLAAQKGDDAA
jgi:hypothetical protein